MKAFYENTSSAALLTPETLSKVWLAATRLPVGHLAYRGHIPSHVFRKLELARSEAAAIKIDLEFLNRLAPDADGRILLREWLTNAHVYSHNTDVKRFSRDSRPETKIFREAKEELRKRSGNTAPVPTRNSLIRLFALMLKDDRDFGGFILDHYGVAYRLIARATRDYQMSFLLEIAELDDIVARLERCYSSRFNEHAHVLKYEADPSLKRQR